MSILLDRLVGYDVDNDSGKTKLGIHPFMDAVTLNMKGFSGAPTNQEINQVFDLQGQTFDPQNTQVPDLMIIAALTSASGSANRTLKEIESILRIAESFRSGITKQRVLDMLGVTLST